ncbi:hypothetical protein [Desulfovibrio inopinatus]|uniref:hypothetical protein n=1 Tax=Desulfovibrio inopinatus TaxID=102109 RepID=UPI00041BD8D2|nr:hypothetical protein [Desulfovibrio inopinatus]
MKDQRGHYYYPAPQNRKVKMYVRRQFDQIEFRLHNDDYPEVWEKHNWVPYDEIKSAAEKYKERGRNADPLQLYDLDVASRLLNDA